LRYIELLEEALGRRAVLDLQPMQKGDVPATTADVSALEEDVGYRPSTPVEVGIPRFVEWYRNYYKV
jgi:UDP-glucuronate 4-epimerase